MQRIEDNDAFLMAIGDGSRIEIHAIDADKDSWTQLAQTAQAGDSMLRLTEVTGWEVGDQIAIAATGFDMDEAETRTITAISADGRTVTLDAPLDHTHFGEIQSYSNGLTGGDARTWQLDMRAEVALLSRNVTVQGDADASVDGFGGHTMVMDGASMHVDGAEFTLLGQAGIIGRYPLHWHMLGDAAGQYVTNSSIHQTFNKGLTIHGTQNTWVEDNVIAFTIGHSYYFEDGSEFGNVLAGNLGMNTTAAQSVAAAAIGSDHTAVSTYWVTNPNNHLVGNHAAGSDEVGFWFLSQDHTEGLSAASGLYDDYVPRAQRPGQWTGNTSHSNGADGIFVGRQFDETTGERVGVDPFLEQPFALVDFTTYKNVEVGLWVRNGSGDFRNVRVAESNKGAQLWGTSTVEDSLFVGASANDPGHPRGEYHGWELYDRPVHFDGVHFDGFEGAADAAIAGGSGFGRSTNYSAANVTFGDDVADDAMFRAKNVSNANGGIQDLGGSLAGVLHDLTGSLTGTPGALITPGIQDITANSEVDILTYAAPGIAASGFNASAGATWLEASNAWVHSPGTAIGKMNFVTSTDPNEREDFIISRSDNGAELFYANTAQQSNNRAQLNVEASSGVEYTVRYPNGLPDTIRLQVSELEEGQTVFYRFEGLPSDVVFQRARAATDLGDFQSANETVWLREAGGDFLVKIYADRFWDRNVPRADTGDTDRETFLDEFQIIIEGRQNATPSGNQPPLAAPDDPWEPADPEPLPERAASTSETLDITAEANRWSEAEAWSGETPDASDIVVIGPGHTVVLDEDATTRGIIINGGELLVEDSQDISLSSDWILVINGGLFQVGTEDDPFEHDFDLILEGDNPGNDVDILALLAPNAPGVVHSLDQIVETLNGTAGPDTLNGSARADNIWGLAGNDTLRGFAGDDVLNGGSGVNTLAGGGGDDLYRIYNSLDRITEAAGAGRDRVASAVDYSLAADVSVEVLSTNGAAGTAPIDLIGNRLAQTILGNAGDNILGDGGGAGDILRGYAGDDLYIVRSAQTQIIERAGEGIDRVAAAFDYTVSAGDSIEYVTTTSVSGSADLDLTGNELRQRIYGNEGANRIEGGGGRDLLVGRGGADTFVFASDPGFDHMTRAVDFVAGVDQLELSADIFVGTNLGALKTGYFRANLSGQAYDASDRILYDVDSGYLFYDPDGAGGVARTYFGRVDAFSGLTAADFFIA